MKASGNGKEAGVKERGGEGLTTKGTKDSKGETTDFTDNHGFLINNASLDAHGNRMELRSNRIIMKKFLFAKRSCSGEAGSSD